MATITGLLGLLEELIEAVSQVQVLQKLSVACVTAAWWDYFITLDDEVKYFWSAQWSPAKFLFLINRYLVLVATAMLVAGLTSTTVNFPFCKFLIAFWLLITSFAQVVIVQNIAILRLYALYGRSKKILYTLLTILVCCDGGSIAVITLQSLRTQGTATPFPGFHFCFVTSKLNILYLFWFPLFTFELVVLALTIYKIWTDFRTLLSTYRSTLSTGSGQKQPLGGRLISVMLRDYFLYFIIIAVLYGTSLGLYSLKEATQAGFMNQPVVVITSILGTRLLLNIRIENERATTSATTLGVTGEVIEFVVRGPSETSQTTSEYNPTFGV